MKTSVLALMLAAGLSSPALAQQATQSNPDHDAHHPQGTRTEVSQPRSGPMSDGMMNCPMMQGGMMGRMGSGMGGMSMSQPRGDQSVGSLALNAVNQRMHREMAMEYTGNVDADFARNMIAHHQGAIDMAKIVAAFGQDPKIRELAQNIIKAQEDEITMMKSWLAQNVKQ